MSFEIALQSAVYTALSGYAPLTAIASVFDDVPQGSSYPYVVIGDDTFSDRSTDTNLGRRCSIVVHVWSEHRGKEETKIIQGHVSDALERANLTYSGYNFVTVDFDSSDSFLDADGKRRHGVQTFTCLIEKT